MTQKLIIIVDYSNFIYRAYYSSVKDIEIMPWLPFLRALDMLRSCVKICRNGRIPVEFIFAGDAKRDTLDRMKIDPDYKGSRKSSVNRAFYVFSNVMVGILHHMGFDVIFQDGAEGDDIIASCVANLTSKCECPKKCAECKCDNGNRIVIFSADRDLNALLAYNNVSIFRPPSIVYTRENFLKDYEFHPKYFPDYKALIGDKSDNIKGVNGWGEVKAKEHILKGDYMDLLISDKQIEEFNHSKKLVNLKYNLKDMPQNGRVVNMAPNNMGLHRLLMKEYNRPQAEDDILFAEKRLEFELR